MYLHTYFLLYTMSVEIQSNINNEEKCELEAQTKWVLFAKKMYKACSDDRHSTESTHITAQHDDDDDDDGAS